MTNRPGEAPLRKSQLLYVLAPVNPEVAGHLPPVDLATTLIATRALVIHGLNVRFARQEHSTVTLSGYIKAGTEFDLDNLAGWRSDGGKSSDEWHSEQGMP